jgi:hypothetical protein
MSKSCHVSHVSVQHVLLDAGCTLSIEPVQARWGTDEWKAQQWQAVHNAAHL